MNATVFEDARNFAGEDWEKLSKGSRERLLMANGRSPIFAGMKWRQLPESVQKAVIKPMIVDDKELLIRRNKKARGER